jgi:anti-sigma B factor antagonist/stage II sporulation protein AA (anti-sigma F factor antagonist)
VLELTQLLEGRDPVVSVFEMSPLVDGKGLRLAGELDLATAPRLTEALFDFASSEADVHLDLAELSFLDSSGLRAILLLARSRADDRSVVLIKPSPAIMRTFEIVGIDQHPRIEIRHPSADLTTVYVGSVGAGRLPASG